MNPLLSDTCGIILQYTSLEDIISLKRVCKRLYATITQSTIKERKCVSSHGTIYNVEGITMCGHAVGKWVGTAIYESTNDDPEEIDDIIIDTYPDHIRIYKNNGPHGYSAGDIGLTVIYHELVNEIPINVSEVTYILENNTVIHWSTDIAGTEVYSAEHLSESKFTQTWNLDNGDTEAIGYIFGEHGLLVFVTYIALLQSSTGPPSTDITQRRYYYKGELIVDLDFRTGERHIHALEGYTFDQLKWDKLATFRPTNYLRFLKAYLDALIPIAI